MRVRRHVLLPGCSSIAVEGLGTFNFIDGYASLREETAEKLIKAGVAVRDPPIIRVTVPRSPSRQAG